MIQFLYAQRFLELRSYLVFNSFYVLYQQDEPFSGSFISLRYRSHERSVTELKSLFSFGRNLVADKLAFVRKGVPMDN